MIPPDAPSDAFLFRSSVEKQMTITTTFADLGLVDEIVDTLSARGITAPFPVQALTIPDALAGCDVCGKAKTGSGKTLAFGLPVLQRMQKATPTRPTGLVLVPTRELANQVCDELAPAAEAVGRTALAIYGGAPIEQQIEKLATGIDLVVATPGRMIDLIERGAISVADVQHVVVDEADRMADMGFLPQVEWILRNVEGDHQTLLFSATLDGVVNTLIKRYQTDPTMHEVVSEEVTVEEMTHRFVAVHKMDKAKVAASIAKSAGRTIMFTRTKAMADRLAGDLKDLGIKAAPIHGDLRQSSREKSLKDFSDGRLNTLVATDVAARGIHVDDVDVVIQYDPPGDHKTYLHRAGRTARAGESGLVVTLSLWDEELDIKRLQKRIDCVMPIVEMFSNDARLANLVAWDPEDS
ncbi:MAG: DEAD/DEAH box helicase [Acidimicrobiales bacterium]